MRIVETGERGAIDRLCAGHAAEDGGLDRRVRRIVDAVRRGGDAALVRLARRFDHARPPLDVAPERMAAEAARVTPDVRRALASAARHIERVARRQLPTSARIRVAPGIVVEQRVVPLERVGCYVPGGRFPLPSSLLMTAIPARVAGVREIVVVCPRPEPVVMAAALEAGVSRLIAVGGAHAVAALAYGTAGIRRVDKIVGPGNRWVAAAKRIVSADCPIDFHAGPTEIVIVAGAGNPAWIAADLVAQAEHDPDARSIFITWNRRLARAVEAEAAARCAGHAIAARALAAHGAIVLARGEADAMDAARRLAPEHLVVSTERLARQPIAAGAVFVGAYSAQAAGDYATGSNHVLPTAGAARSRGGLSAADFVRTMAVQRITREGLRRIAPAAATLARAEGLTAHAASIEIRFSGRPARPSRRS